ncbi:DMT family transporter [Sphingobium sufflavum]|uniref:DMT family transporter n=1 Tax=Sphingobium sufflavum TaxID=1129547 RepID=UPI001F28629B|nr:DMT family transporter [Sphingobium sufflavum]MCE7795580.1 DMT family transporter [Sphingobium sufflavum]
MTASPAARLLPPSLLPFGAACLGIAIFSIMDTVMKHLSMVMGAYNAMLWRTMFSLIVLTPAFLLLGGRWPSRTVLVLHACRGLVMGCSLVLFFWALARVPMALGIALSFVAPLIGLGLAALFLKERVGSRAVSASVVAFAGVLVILAGQPGGGAVITDWRAPAAILLAALLYAIGTVLSRPLAQRAGPLEIALFFNIVAGGLFLTGAPWFAAFPPSAHLPALLAATCSANVSIMLVAWAYARAEAQYLLPVEYSAFLWAALFGWLVFGETVTPATLAGAALIMGACLWTARGGTPAAPHEEIGGQAINQHGDS